MSKVIIPVLVLLGIQANVVHATFNRVQCEDTFGKEKGDLSWPPIFAQLPDDSGYLHLQYGKLSLYKFPQDSKDERRLKGVHVLVPKLIWSKDHNAVRDANQMVARPPSIYFNPGDNKDLVELDEGLRSTLMGRDVVTTDLKSRRTYLRFIDGKGELREISLNLQTGTITNKDTLISKQVNFFVSSPDGTKSAISTFQNKIIIWDAVQQKIISETQVPPKLGAILALAWGIEMEVFFTTSPFYPVTNHRKEAIHGGYLGYLTNQNGHFELGKMVRNPMEDVTSLSVHLHSVVHTNPSLNSRSITSRRVMPWLRQLFIVDSSKKRVAIRRLQNSPEVERVVSSGGFLPSQHWSMNYIDLDADDPDRALVSSILYRIFAEETKDARYIAGQPVTFSHLDSIEGPYAIFNQREGAIYQLFGRSKELFKQLKSVTHLGVAKDGSMAALGGGHPRDFFVFFFEKSMDGRVNEMGYISLADLPDSLSQKFYRNEFDPEEIGPNPMLYSIMFSEDNQSVILWLNGDPMIRIKFDLDAIRRRGI